MLSAIETHQLTHMVSGLESGAKPADQPSELLALPTNRIFALELSNAGHSRNSATGDHRITDHRAKLLSATDESRRCSYWPHRNTPVTASGQDSRVRLPPDQGCFQRVPGQKMP